VVGLNILSMEFQNARRKRDDTIVRRRRFEIDLCLRGMAVWESRISAFVDRY